MFNTASGVKIPFPERIEEKYFIEENRIIFNISFEKLKPFINDFIKDIAEPLYLIIQIPLKGKPNSFSKGPFKEELLFFDLRTKKQIYEAMDRYGELLLNDGMSKFGIRSHETADEIFIEKYKIVYIYSKNIKQYFGLLDSYGIIETNDLITAWDTFSADYPGKCSRMTINNIDIYDVVEILKETVIYHSQIIEDLNVIKSNYEKLILVAYIIRFCKINLELGKMCIMCLI